MGLMLCLVFAAIFFERSSATDLVKITNFRFDYVKPEDICRSAIVSFTTTQWANSSHFKLYYFVRGGFFSKTEEFKNICFVDQKHQSSGYCVPPTHNFIHGSTSYLKLEQLFQNGNRKNSSEYRLTIDFLKQRTGPLLNFTASVSNSSASVKFSWIQQWPKDASMCEGLLAETLRQRLKYYFECALTSKKKEKECKTRCVSMAGTNCLKFEDHVRCTSTTNKRWQRCNFIIQNLEVGTTYSFKMKYSLGGIHSFSNYTVVEVSTLPDAPTIAPEVNCSKRDDNPYFQWKIPNERLLKPYKIYKLQWPDGNAKEFFFGEFTQYQLKTLKLSHYQKPLEFYLNICTEKNQCSNQQTPCRITKTTVRKKIKPDNVDAKLMLWVVIGILLFVAMVGISTFCYRRMDNTRRNNIQVIGPRGPEDVMTNDSIVYTYPDHPTIHESNSLGQLIPENDNISITLATYPRCDPIEFQQPSSNNPSYDDY